MGVLNVVFLIGLAMTLTQMDIWQFSYGPPPVLRMLLVLPLVTLVITLLIARLTAVGWQGSDWGWRAKIYAGAVTLTLLVFPILLKLLESVRVSLLIGLIYDSIQLYSQVHGRSISPKISCTKFE